MTITAAHVPHQNEPAPSAPHLVVQILGLVLFAGFAIVSTVLAFVMFWPAGFVLALAIAWFGFRPILAHRPVKIAPETLGPVFANSTRDADKNASFTAYRADVLRRLEDEQVSFDGFLSRLREAKNASEFDTFMEDRAQSKRDMTADDTASDDITSRANPAKAGEY